MKNEIKKKALQLNDKERAELAHLLLASLNPSFDYSSEEEWAHELKERIEKYESGNSETLTWEKIRKAGRNLLEE